MSSPEIDIRTAKLTDVPLIHRLAEVAHTLDAEIGCTREFGHVSALLPPVLLRQRGVYTLVGRAHRQPVMGQYRLKADDHLAQILALAPQLEEGVNDTAWLHLIDALTVNAGRRGAHMLTAEVDESSPLFCTLRHAGFAVYARQDLYRAASGAELRPTAPLQGTLTEETDSDAMDVQLLYANIVPRLVQPITVPSADSTGLVYRRDGRVHGYIAVTPGRAGMYVVPFLHPDVPTNEAAAAIRTAIAHSGDRADKLPVYVCMRRYQDWLDEPLSQLGLELCAAQAVMVRHIAAGVRQAGFARVASGLGVPGIVSPPMSPVSVTIDLTTSYDPVDTATGIDGAN